MTKKLAITISGAVSLGSYEAGVLYEIIRAIEHHNRLEEDETNKIEIDVLTGASAGGMTATIAAQKLLFEASSLQDPYNNSLYQAWVLDASFDSLFNLQTGEDPTHSILSSNYVEAISRKHITERYASQTPPTREKHTAAADIIQLGLALANLNGVDYVRQLRSGEPFFYTRYQDEMEREFHSTDPADDSCAAWDRIRNAAVSCGAFPFAFRTKDLARQFIEYNRSRFLPPIPSACFPSADRTFTYTDGGTFQNEPLGLAKNLVNKIDPRHAHNDERFYLFVSPGARAGTSNSQFRAELANLSGTAATIVASILNQAQFQDWIRAEQINERIQLLDKQAQGLSKAIIDNKIKPSQLQPVSTSLLSLLFEDDHKKLLEAQSRLKTQYQKEYDALKDQTSQQIADIWIDTVLAFETAADLADKDEMQIFGITATEQELASSKLQAFLGFFDRVYRDHDYDVGRKKAREFIQRVHNNQNVDLWFPYHPVNNPTVPAEPWMPIRPIDEKLNGLELSRVSEDQRKKFRDRLADRADAFLSQVGVSWLGRKAVYFFFIKPKLNNWLGLP
jgi:predicted acylesterase/phospholipase RssA